MKKRSDMKKKRIYKRYVSFTKDEYELLTKAAARADVWLSDIIRDGAMELARAVVKRTVVIKKTSEDGKNE